MLDNLVDRSCVETANGVWSEKKDKCTERLIKIDAYWAISLYVKKLQKGSLAYLQNEP